MSQDLEPKTIDQMNADESSTDSIFSSEHRFSRRVGLGGAIATLSLAACSQTPNKPATGEPKEDA